MLSNPQQGFLTEVLEPWWFTFFTAPHQGFPTKA